MNSLRGISRKIDAMLLLIIAGLVLALALSWNYYQNRRMTFNEKETLAAGLLAYNLPGAAAALIEETISRQPVSEKSIKLRKVLAEIYMNELNDFEKALAEMVFIKTYAPQSEVASGSEEAIRYCLNRLGRVYDAERSKILAGGGNPIENNLKPTTVVRFGNRHALSLEELQLRLQENGLTGDKLTPEKVDALINSMAQEMLLARAAERENLKKETEFIQRVQKFEKSLAINSYLQKYVFKDPSLNEEKQRQLLADEINKLVQREAMQIDRKVIEAALFKTASATAQPSINNEE